MQGSHTVPGRRPDADAETGGLAGRTVIVTGGTGALGTAVVGALVEAGAHCHLPYLDEREAAAFALRTHPQVSLAGPVDLSDEAAVAGTYAREPRLWASIHLAGGFAMSPIAQTGREALLRQLEMNFVSCYLCCAAAVRAMVAHGEGRIVNVAARPALEWRAGAGMTAYAASKAAVAALTAALGSEVVGSGILVNAVAPSILDTPANRRAMPDADHAAWPGTAEVATLIRSLVSPENRSLQGAVIPVYGRA